MRRTLGRTAVSQLLPFYDFAPETLLIHALIHPCILVHRGPYRPGLWHVEPLALRPSLYLPSSVPPPPLACPMPGLLVTPAPSNPTRLGHAPLPSTQPIPIVRSSTAEQKHRAHHGSYRHVSFSDRYSGSPGHGMGSLIRLAQVVFEHWQHKHSPPSVPAGADSISPVRGRPRNKPRPSSIVTGGAGGSDKKKKSAVGEVRGEGRGGKEKVGTYAPAPGPRQGTRAEE